MEISEAAVYAITGAALADGRHSQLGASVNQANAFFADASGAEEPIGAFGSFVAR